MMLTGDLNDLADAIRSGDKLKIESGPMREFAEALMEGDKWKAPSPYRDFVEAIIS